MPENMAKPSMLPAPVHFQYAPSFIGTHQHLFVCLSTRQNKFHSQLKQYTEVCYDEWQCDFRFDLFFSFSFVLVLQYFFVLVLVFSTTK